MAKQHKQKEGQKPAETVGIEVEHFFPTDIMVTASNHVIVQQDKSDYRLSFFDVRPPILQGATMEERREQLKGIKKVQARCIAEINMSSERMPDLIFVLLDNLQKNNPDQFAEAVKLVNSMHDSGKK